jgi:hypothetical protein
MKCIESLIEITNEIGKLVDLIEQKTDRDEMLEKLTRLLDEREKLISTFSSFQFSEEDKKRLKQIDAKNQVITKKMITIKQIIQKDIMQAKKGKVAFKGYNQIGQAYSFDGTFFDKKK